MSSSTTKGTTIRISNEHYQKIEELRARGVTASGLISVLLQLYFDKLIPNVDMLIIHEIERRNEAFRATQGNKNCSRNKAA
jgi:hypothetical protein